MGARGILSLLYPGSDIFATKEILLGDDIHERISYQCRQLLPQVSAAEPRHGDLLAKGLCERIGIDGKFTYKPQVEGKEKLDAVDVAMPTHAEAIAAVLDALVDPKNGVIASMKEIDAVGHRVVHGGEKFASSVVITDEVMAAIEECNPLAPLHNPANIIGIKACQEKMPGVPMVAVFDTAFHQTMPAKAYTYAIPDEYYENDKMRRYGFHGTSHRYVSQRCAEILGKPIEELKIVSCHLGTVPPSLPLTVARAFYTSMGSDASGRPAHGHPFLADVGYRPGIMEFIMKKYNMSMADMMTTLNKQSGVLGISGVSSDFRDLDNAAAEGNQRAALAVEVFEYGVRKMIAEYAAAMGGVDAVVFTAGVGENSADMRLHFVDGLQFMGIEIDPEKEQHPRRGAHRLPRWCKGQGSRDPHRSEGAEATAKDTAELVG